jgi:hypothetical protein
MAKFSLIFSELSDVFQEIFGSRFGASRSELRPHKQGSGFWVQRLWVQGVSFLDFGFWIAD